MKKKKKKKKLEEEEKTRLEGKPALLNLSVVKTMLLDKQQLLR